MSSKDGSYAHSILDPSLASYKIIKSGNLQFCHTVGIVHFFYINLVYGLSFSTWWPRQQQCTLGVQLQLEATIAAWEGVVPEAAWACQLVGVVPVDPLPVEMSSHTNVNNVWKLFHLIINWSSTYGCTLEKNHTNARTVTEDSNSCHMYNNTQDYTLVGLPPIRQTFSNLEWFVPGKLEILTPDIWRNFFGSVILRSHHFLETIFRDFTNYDA